MKTFIKDILPRGSSNDAQINSTGTASVNGNIFGEHVTSPSWVVGVYRWMDRSPWDFLKDGHNQATGPNPTVDINLAPLVIQSDCIAIQTNSQKTSLTPVCVLTLKNGLFNYLTAIAPGDYFSVNITPDQNTADNISNQILDQTKASSPNFATGINSYTSGFKGIFKITSVRKSTQMDPETGSKFTFTTVTGHAMSELSTKIYFVSQLFSNQEAKKNSIFDGPLWSQLNKFVDPKLPNQIQTIVWAVFQCICGIGPNLDSFTTKTSQRQFNYPIKIPGAVLNLMGVGSKNSDSEKSNEGQIIDLYRLLLGVQKYQIAENKESNWYKGFFPSNFTLFANSGTAQKNTWVPINTSEYCEGSTFIVGDYWNDIEVSQIIKSFVNQPINELYTTFRVDLDGKIMPTLIMRQSPFSTDIYKEDPYTSFSNLPRWRVDPSLIYSVDIGRDDGLRVNFVQVWGTVQATNKNANEYSIANQAEENYHLDVADIVRNGLYPIVHTSQFDDFDPKGTTFASKWSRLLADQMIGGHLKLSGSITCAGIYDPICVGDNLQLDSYEPNGSGFSSTIFHIESVTHSASLNENGTVQFRTILQLSNGVIDLKQEAKPEYRYAEMLYETQNQSQINSDAGGNPTVSSEANSVYGSISDPLQNYEGYRFVPEEYDPSIFPSKYDPSIFPSGDFEKPDKEEKIK